MADPAIVAALNAAFSGDDGADTLIELEGAFKNKPKQLADILLEELAKGLDAEVGGLLNARWKPNLGPQTEAFYSRADELFYGGAAGGGKQVSPDTWVKTSLGWRRADDITLDDYLIGPDDHPAQVLGIYPHVNIPLYRFTFEDESSVVTGDEHLWLVHDVTRTYLLFSPVKGTRIHTAAGRLATSADLFAEFENGHRFAVPHAISGTWTWKKAVAVDYVGTGDGLCFAVDREDGLHIIEGNTVTHNTDLIIGLCVSDISPQKKSIVFRRDYKQLKDIIERMANLLDGTGARLNANSMLIKGIPNGKTVEFGSINTYDDVNKYKGRAHDLKAFDELSDFNENMYTFLIGWARTTDLGVPVRVVGAGNPPTSTDGEWVIRRWAPWIDPQYENPAKPGELRYFATIDGEDKELESGEAFVWKGETIKPKSRTFIPARLDDNPSLAKTDYKTVLQNMPEPLRSQLLYGDFGLTIKDDPWQVCPITWVRQSKERWQLAEASGDLKRSESGEVTYGLDVGEEGPDMTVLIKLSGQYVQWVRYLKEPDLMKQANWVIAQMTGSKNSKLGVDALGVGSGLSARLKQLGIDVVGVKVSTKSHRRARGNNLPFFNLRSDLWWYIREKLDPGSGLPLLAVYPDPKLITELSAPRYTLTARDTIQVEGRDEIKERIGRSPDAASALMLALYVTRERHVPPRLA